MVNSSSVTSLYYLESRLILVTKNRSIAPTAKLLQLEIEMTIMMKNMKQLCAGTWTSFKPTPFSSSCSNIQSSSSSGQANLTLGDSNIELVARLPCCQSPNLGFLSFSHRQCHHYRPFHEHHQYHLSNLHHHHHQQYRGHFLQFSGLEKAC